MTALVVLLAAGTTAWVHGSARARAVQQELTWQLGPRFFTDFDLELYLPQDGEPAAAVWTVAGGGAAPARAPAPSVQLLPGEEPSAALASTTAQAGMQAVASAELPPAAALAGAGAIVARHEQRFTALEQVAMNKLDVLFATGRQEYDQERRVGVLDQMVLVLKYLEAGRLLERNMDLVFQAMVADLKHDLAASEQPLDAVGLVEAEYVSRKERLRGHYVGRIRQQTR